MIAALLAVVVVAPAADADDALHTRAELDFRLASAADERGDGADAVVETGDLSPAAPSYGTVGSMRWSVHGALGLNVETASEYLALGGVGLERFVAPDLSIEVQLNGIGADQEGPNAAAAQVGLLLRWHARHGEGWTFFLDGGGGLSYSTENIPATGSSFNFTPQAGCGMSFSLPDDARLLVGLKWFHVSNANTRESNPGLDTVMFWAGMSWPF